MKAQAVLSFLVDGKWLNFFLWDYEGVSFFFPIPCAHPFFRPHAPPYHSLQPSERLKSEKFLPD